MITLILFGAHVCAWSTDQAFGRSDEHPPAVVERLEELERELVEAREQGNYAEVAEIETLLEELRDAAVTRTNQGSYRGDERDEDTAALREWLRDLEEELKVARRSGNEPEVQEIQALMDRLRRRISGGDTAATAHAGAMEVDIDGAPEVRLSSATCGFTLAYSNTAESQVAIMEPAGILVGSVNADETITVVMPITGMHKPFQIEALAQVWDGRGAEISFALSESSPSWHRPGNGSSALAARGRPKDGATALFIKMRSRNGQAAIRLSRFRLTSDGEAHSMTLPVSALSVREFPRPKLPPMHPAIELALIEWDWRMQDGIGTEREPRTYGQAIENTLRRGDDLIEYLAQAGAIPDRAITQWEEVRGEWRRLQALPTASDAAWQDLWRKAHLLRREIVLQNSLADAGSIAFVKCVPTNNSIMQQQYIGRFARPGGGVFVLEEPGRSMRCRALTEGKLPAGAYQHLDVSYDGRRMLFAFCETNGPPEDARQGNPGRYYDIYEIRTDGSVLKPVIVSSFDDIAPRYLPNGKIVFASTRRGGYSRCGPDFAPCHTLTVADADGGNQRLISFHEVHEYDPAVMNDGRIVYTRWDYVDREASLYQQLWVTRPNGTNPAIYYGNNTFNPMATFEPRAVPGSNRIMAIAGCHHSIAAGSVVLVDVRQGVDGLAPLRRLTPDALFPETEARIEGGPDVPQRLLSPEARRWPHHTYKSPLPLSEDVFLASYSFDELVYIETAPNPANMFGLYIVDRFGNKELLYRDLNVSSVWPMPLRVRPRQNQWPGQFDPATPPEGAFYVQNVYDADPPLPQDVKITHLRIIHVFPRTSEFETYPLIGIPTAACGREVLGTVPVEPDGSAYFKAPAGIALAFQALDELGQSVQFMRSITYLQPGENVSCIGCHEHRMSAPPNRRMGVGLAIKRLPSKIRPGPEGSRPFSYPLLVQPILDKHCVECHSGQGAEGDVILTGELPEPEDEDRSPFSLSYLALAPLVKYAQWPVFDKDFRVSNSEPVTKPDFFGARASPLITMLRRGHEGVRLNDEEFEQLITWADNNILFYGTFDLKDQARQLSGQLIEGPVVD
ncbi:MAG: PD40 domain-containing protein [Phycisphaerales bacterium]|nr:MAG: PD40 domain-containing protein [Phycisphaerales bacterium]